MRSRGTDSCRRHCGSTRHHCWEGQPVSATQHPCQQPPYDSIPCCPACSSPAHKRAAGVLRAESGAAAGKPARRGARPGGWGGLTRRNRQRLQPARQAALPAISAVGVCTHQLGLQPVFRTKGIPCPGPGQAPAPHHVYSELARRSSNVSRDHSGVPALQHPVLQAGVINDNAVGGRNLQCARNHWCGKERETRRLSSCNTAVARRRTTAGWARAWPTPAEAGAPPPHLESGAGQYQLCTPHLSEAVGVACRHAGGGVGQSCQVGGRRRQWLPAASVAERATHPWRGTAGRRPPLVAAGRRSRG